LNEAALAPAPWIVDGVVTPLSGGFQTSGETAMWHFLPILAAALVVAALIYWGVSSLNPHAFAKAAKDAEANAGAGLATDAKAAAAAAASTVTSIGRGL
jgi:hypothetical protein